MKTRLLIAVPAILAVAALAGAFAPGPNTAAAQDPAASDADTVTVTGVGSVESTPDDANFSFGVESRGRTAQAAIAANGAAMEKVIAALRQAGAREIATQWVSVYAVTDENGTVTGYSASNSVSASIGVRRAHRRRGRGRRESDQWTGHELERRRSSLPPGARRCRRRCARARRGARPRGRSFARRDHLALRGRLAGDPVRARGEGRRCRLD